jgi:hypothetical protein
MQTTKRRDRPGPVSHRRGRRWRLGLLAALTVLAATVAVLQPWNLFTDVEVSDADPFRVATADRAAPASLARGRFMGIAHATAGRATLGATPTGSSELFLDDLSTDNGPTLRVYLSRTPADGDARRFGDEPLDLGDLKGNLGDQVYAVPPGTDVAQYRSVVIWCERFGVAFGAAPLDPS